MGWFTRIDRFTDTHLCFSQDASNSCGLASIKMVLFKVNKLRPGHAAVTTENWVEQIYKKYDTAPVDIPTEGVLFYMLADALNEMKIGTWKHEAPPAQDIPELLIKKLSPDVVGLSLINTAMRGFPMLLDVQWGGTGRHAVVVDTINKFPFVDAWWATICDPADGDVHITRIKKGQPISYQGRRVTFSGNLWGDPQHNYGKNQVSQGIVTNVIYCETPP